MCISTFTDVCGASPLKLLTALSMPRSPVAAAQYATVGTSVGTAASATHSMLGTRTRNRRIDAPQIVYTIVGNSYATGTRNETTSRRLVLFLRNSYTKSPRYSLIVQGPSRYSFKGPHGQTHTRRLRGERAASREAHRWRQGPCPHGQTHTPSALAAGRRHFAGEAAAAPPVLPSHHVRFWRVEVSWVGRTGCSLSLVGALVLIWEATLGAIQGGVWGVSFRTY